MNYLLDTCTFLWLTLEPQKLSGKARALCVDPDNALFLSAVSVWEIEVKYRMGRLELDEAPEDYIPVQRVNHQVFELPFGEEAALRYGQLPDLHKDPFDRMLVCQAQEHDLTILTPDKQIIDYPVETEW